MLKMFFDCVAVNANIVNKSFEDILQPCKNLTYQPNESGQCLHHYEWHSET